MENMYISHNSVIADAQRVRVGRPARGHRGKLVFGVVEVVENCVDEDDSFAGRHCPGSVFLLDNEI
jgi:hypothetical protein